MNYASNLTPPLQSIIWSDNQSYVKQTLLILAGVFVLALASQFSIPLEPVPLTFQSVTVVLLGMTYGAKRGSLVVLTYWMAGIMGLPVFADFPYSILKFFGPTGGYLLGFLPAAFISGYLAEKGWAKHIATSFLAACIGAGLIFISGVTFLSTLIGWNSAIKLGFVPFVLTELVKLAALSVIIPKLWKAK